MTLLHVPPPGQRYDGKGPAKTITAWSHSAVTLFEECPQRWYAIKVLGFPDPPSDALKKGRRVHEAGAKYLQDPAEPLPAPYSKFAQAMSALKALNPYADLKMVLDKSWAIDRGSYFKNDNAWLRLEWDAGVLYPDNTADIIDFKTGRRYDKNDDQMELYALSAFIKFRSPEVLTRLWYLDSGLEVTAKFEIKDKSALMSKWTQRANAMLKATAYPARPNDNCKWCPLSKHKGGPCGEG